MFMILSVTAVGSLVLLLWRFTETSPWKVNEETALTSINELQPGDLSSDDPRCSDISLQKPTLHNDL